MRIVDEVITLAQEINLSVRAAGITTGRIPGDNRRTAQRGL